MIPQRYIDQWSSVAPWQELHKIEQDLIITRALLSIFSDPFLKDALAFRGGTALNKLFFKPASRYSEDIDCVQVKAEPIGPTLTALRVALDGWLGNPKRDFSRGLVTLTYKTISEEGIPLTLKIEINCREHFSVLGYQSIPFGSESAWAAGAVDIQTFRLEELLSTKLRALYQRRKGRDLFDLYTALTAYPDLDLQALIESFLLYMSPGQRITKTLFVANMEHKMANEEFKIDILSLLPYNSATYDHEKAYDLVREKLIERL